MTRIFIWASIPVVLMAAAIAQEPIRVGAWNIERLGSPDERDWPYDRPSHGHGVQRDAQDIAEQILAMNVDVLALSEIDDDDQDDERRNNSILDTVFYEHLNQESGNDWKYRLFAGRRRDSTEQHTGLAWNREKVTAVGRPLRVAVSDLTSNEFAEWDRTPHAMKFRRAEGRTDFVVVPIHMKAGATEGNVEQRNHEARSLLVELQEIREHFRDDDIILIGDFNFRGLDDGRARDEPAGGTFREQGLFDLNYYDQGTHITDWALDRCYIPRSQRENEFEDVQSIEVLVPENKTNFRHDLSDHWPIVLQFPELEDDDPIG